MWGSVTTLPKDGDCVTEEDRGFYRLNASCNGYKSWNVIQSSHAWLDWARRDTWEGHEYENITPDGLVNGRRKALSVGLDRVNEECYVTRGTTGSNQV